MCSFIRVTYQCGISNVSIPICCLDLLSDLDKGSGQGVMSYDISMSTLNEVFMKVEGKSTIEQGKFICIIHIKSIFQMTVCQFSIYNVLHMIRTKECD